MVGRFVRLSTAGSTRLYSCSVRLLLPPLLLLVAFACSHRGGTTLRIAVFRGEEFTPLAHALGHFQAENLTVEVLEVPSSSKAMEALFGGSVEAVAGGYDQAVRLAAEGRAAQSFTVLTVRSPLALVASPKSRVRALADLKGATIGVSAFSSSGNNLVNHLLARHGLTQQDVSIVATGGGHAVTVAAAEQGRLDAVVTLPASLAILKGRHAGLAVLADGTTPEGTRAIFGVDRYPAVCLMAEGRWLTANPDVARALARAMLRTLDWVRSHSAEEFREKLGRATGPPEELEGFRAAIASASPDGTMPDGGPEAVRDALAASAPTVKSVDLSSTYTAAYLPR